jgi:predicted amidophosphoribosyltransferase
MIDIEKLEGNCSVCGKPFKKHSFDELSACATKLAKKVKFEDI